MSTNRESRCSHCGQPLEHYRLGVKLTPLKCEILDAIARRGGGEGDRIKARELGDPTTIKAHVWQINSILEETDWYIDGAGGRDGGYRLMHRRGGTS